MNDQTQSPNQGDTKNLSELLAKLVPLVDGMAGKLGLLLALSLLVLVWIFIYVLYFYKATLAWSILVLSLAGIPAFIVFRFWLALKSLTNIPNIAKEIVEDVSEDVTNNWKAAKSDKKGALNLVGQIRHLFQIKSLLASTGNIFEQYFNVSILLSPISLIVGALSLIGLGLLFFTGLCLAIISMF